MSFEAIVGVILGVVVVGFGGFILYLVAHRKPSPSAKKKGGTSDTDKSPDPKNPEPAKPEETKAEPPTKERRVTRTGFGFKRLFTAMVKTLLVIGFLFFVYWCLMYNGLGQITTWGISHEIQQICCSTKHPLTNGGSASGMGGTSSSSTSAAQPALPSMTEIRAAAKAERKLIEGNPITFDVEYLNNPEWQHLPYGRYQINVSSQDGKAILQLCSPTDVAPPKDASPDDYPCTTDMANGTIPVKTWQARAVSADQGRFKVSVSFKHVS